MANQLGKKIKHWLKLHVPMRLQGVDIFVLNRSLRHFKKVEKKYAKNLQPQYTLAPHAKKPARVWVCWLQGMDHAPHLVQTCYAALQKNWTDQDITLVTQDNLFDLVSFPDFIIDKWRKGIISNTHFSDLLRLELLIKYGGTWVDATVLCTGKIPQYVTDSAFFVFRDDFKNDQACDLSSWFISAVPNHPILLHARDLLYAYWRKENKLVDYFLFHFFVTMCMRTYRDLLYNAPFNSNLNPHTLQFVYLFNQYDAKIYQYLQELCFVHKLTYKFNLQRDLTGTFYEKLITKGGKQ